MGEYLLFSETASLDEEHWDAAERQLQDISVEGLTNIDVRLYKNSMWQSRYSASGNIFCKKKTNF